jgi:excisionase family DNA binding protein
MKPTRNLLTTGDVAAHCHVTYETVNAWIKAGKLKSFTTPGRHHRIAVEDFRQFLETYHLPPYQPANGYRVLVVDDTPEVVRMLCRLLQRRFGCEVATAVDGFEAGLQVAAFQPDLVILDLRMPQLDGFQVCRRLKSRPETRRTKVLVLTGFATADNIRRMAECGADDWLAKPFDPEELKRRVGALLGMKAPAARTA